MLRVVKLPGVGALAAPHPEVDLLLVRCATCQQRILRFCHLLSRAVVAVGAANS